MNKRILMAELRLEIAGKLCEIEDLCHSYGLTSITRITCIARDPENDNMAILTTNEPDGAATTALEVGRKLLSKPII